VYSILLAIFKFLFAAVEVTLSRIGLSEIRLVEEPFVKEWSKKAVNALSLDSSLR
jgi:hypothetical protein